MRCIQPLSNDGDRLWSDESVELFLSRDGKGCRQSIFNTVGARRTCPPRR